MDDFHLTPQQRQYLTSLLDESASKPLAHRAQIFILYDEGLPTHQIAEQTGLTRSAARYWRARFWKEGMALFPDYVEESGQPDVGELPAAGQQEAMPEGDEVQQPTPESSPLPTNPEPVEIQVAPAEEQRLQFISAQAKTIFDSTHPLHHLNEQFRQLLGLAASLPSFQAEGSARKNLVATGHWLESQAKADLAGEHERNLLIAILTSQPGKKKRSMGGDLGLTEAEIRAIRLLAAILGVARALDESDSQSTRLQTVERLTKGLRLIVGGPHAVQDAAAAERYASAWNRISEQRLEVLEASQAERLHASELPMPQPHDKAGLLPQDPMSEAGRKVLLLHFAEMLAHEAGTRLGEDIEELHDMRVATRRMRAAFEVFGESFEPKVLKNHLKGLKATGRALGRVRDLDVFMEKAQHYLEGLPENERSGLDPLLHVWQEEREQARSEMNTYLISDAYQEFKVKFNRFLQTPGEGALAIVQEHLTPYLVREVAPVLIYNRLASVRAYESVLAQASIGQMHALRIEFKKLRYTVEYFREVLGDQAKEVINDIKKLQDHLGDLNDADVATNILRGFLDSWDERQASLPVSERQNPEAIVGYLAARHAERHRLMVTFQEAWVFFLRPEFRLNLALATSVL